MILELKHINFSFTTTRSILDNISLLLEEQKIYALMGANGAGKTTLFNLITGFIKPQGGVILYKGKDIVNELPYKINRYGISRTFQDLRIITKLTVRENIELVLKNNPSDKWYNALVNYKGDIVESALFERKPEKIGEKYFLNDVMDSLAGEISYGQQKLLTLACCDASEASLLLLDEPVAGVQPEYRNKITYLLKELKNEGKTILIIEHNTDFVGEIADEIFFLNEGKIVAFETIEQLRNNELVKEAYL